jgi:hypothetical protein
VDGESSKRRPVALHPQAYDEKYLASSHKIMFCGRVKANFWSWVPIHGFFWGKLYNPPVKLLYANQAVSSPILASRPYKDEGMKLPYSFFMFFAVCAPTILNHYADLRIDGN